MLNILVVVLILFGNNVDSESEATSPRVVLPHGGVLIGSYMKTETGSSFRSFRGIPYAEPPVGSLRFKPSVPAQSWSGEKLAIEDGKSCLLHNPFSRQNITSGDEDCLYLNVYTPEVGLNHKPLSVMVFFHGGGWMSGTSDSNIYGPQKLLDHNVVLVTTNYRIGALGFLSTGTKECPGNNGLKDQVLALKWVRDNIQAFAGNASDVTIFGESAGGASVAYHMYSAASKGLFHRGILQSGTNFEVWAISDASLIIERSKKLGTLLNCPANDSYWQGFIDCLRTKSAYEIASIVNEFYMYDVEPTMFFTPVVEPDIEGAFLAKYPEDIDIPPNGHIPIVIGLTSDEGLLKSLALINLLKDDFIVNYESALPQLLYYSHYPQDIQQKITEKIDEFYFRGKHDWSLENHQNLTNLITDNYFTWGMDKFLRHRFAAAEKSAVSATYIYLLNHRGPITLAGVFHKVPGYQGVCHGDDLIYLFTNEMHMAKGNSNDDKMKWEMPKMWTDFAKTGNPTPDPTADTPKWIPCDKFPLRYALIGSKSDANWTLISNEEGLFEDRVKFWRDLEDVCVRQKLQRNFEEN